MLQPPEGTTTTFLAAPFADDIQTLDADFAVIGVPFGVPYNMRQVHYGATEAPRAVRERSFRFGSMLESYDFDLGCAFADLGIRLVDCGDVAGDPHSIGKNAERAISAIRQIANQGIVPIVLGGDDSVSAIAVGSLESRAPVTVVQIDAHIDYRDEVNGIRDGYSSPMRRAAEMPWVERIVNVGARGVGAGRNQEIKDTLARGNRIVTARHFRENGIDAAIEQIPENGNFHIVLDCDGLDPSVMPGTSVASPGGLTYFEVATLIGRLGRHGKIVGFNLAEYYPSLDINGISALAVVRLLVTMMAGTKIDLRSVPSLYRDSTLQGR
jgi:agmatinase